MKNQKAFTLVEIMIVMAILGLMMVVAVPKLETTGAKLKREGRTLSVLIKRLHHLARLNRKTYRLVLEFGEGTNSQFWVEAADRSVLMQAPTDDDSEAPPSDEGFEMDPTITKKPHEFSSNIKIERVEIASRNAVFSGGRIYIHFIPEGLAEESIIQIGDGKETHWSIVVNPLTGQAKIVPGVTSLEELRQ